MNNSTNDILTIALICVFAVMMVLLVIFCILYLKTKTKEKKSNNIQATTQDSKKTTKTTKSYTVDSIFDFMEFDKIEDNMIITKNGTKYVMVVECQGVNYDLMSEVEKNAVEEGFIQFLNTLRHPIQIYTQTRTINLENSIQTYKAKVNEIEAELEKQRMKYEQMVNSDLYTEEQLPTKKLL